MDTRELNSGIRIKVSPKEKGYYRNDIPSMKRDLLKLLKVL